MTAYILIIMLHGWGAGVGSTGNAVTVAEFSTMEKCVAAATFVKETRAAKASCFPK